MSSGQDTIKDSEGNDEVGRKRKRTTTGFQTDEDSLKHLVETLEEINCKLDVALARIKEIQEKQKELKKKNASLKECLEFAHNSIKEITKRVETEETTLSKLTKDVNAMSETVTFKCECAIKLESHSRRNNLIFYNITEEENESTTMTEDTLYIFMEEKLKMEEEKASNICIERAHRLGKRKDDNKPCPIIAKFTFHEDKEHILFIAYKLAGTGLGISQDFPQETKRFN